MEDFIFLKIFRNISTTWEKVFWISEMTRLAQDADLVNLML